MAFAVALGLTPVVLLADVWSSSAFAPFRDRPAALAAGALAGLVVVAAAAVLFARRPGAFVLLVALALPFRIPIAIGGATANLLAPLYVVLAAGALAEIARAWRAPPDAEPRPRPGAVEWALAATLVLYALQATYSSDVAQAVQHLAFFYVPFALLFALLVRIDWDRRLLLGAFGVLVAVALVCCAVAFVEAATRSVLWNDKLITSNTYNPSFRANALFYDPNILGRFLVVVMACAAAAIAGAFGRALLAGGALLAILFAGVVTTGSQSSLIALLVALAVVTALAGFGRVVVTALVAGVVFGAMVLVAAPGAVGLHSDSSGALRKATSGRTDLVRGGAELFGDRPVLGFGSGSFEREYRKRNGAVDKDVSASHTTPLTIAAEQGLPGLAVYLALLVAAFAALLGAARGVVARIAVAAAFAALVTHTLVYAAFLEDPLAWALLAVGVALAARPASARDPVAAPSPRASTALA